MLLRLHSVAINVSERGSSLHLALIVRQVQLSIQGCILARAVAMAWSDSKASKTRHCCNGTALVQPAAREIQPDGVRVNSAVHGPGSCEFRGGVLSICRRCACFGCAYFPAELRLICVAACVTKPRTNGFIAPSLIQYPAMAACRGRQTVFYDTKTWTYAPIGHTTLQHQQQSWVFFST